MLHLELVSDGEESLLTDFLISKRMAEILAIPVAVKRDGAKILVNPWGAKIFKDFCAEYEKQNLAGKETEEV